MNHHPLTPQQRRRLQLATGPLIVWVAVGPWVWGYAGSASAVASHIFFLFAFAPTALLITVLRPAAIVVRWAGLWLAMNPWLLDYATNHVAWLSDGITGVLISLVAARAAGSRGPTASATATATGAVEPAATHA